MSTTLETDVQEQAKTVARTAARMPREFRAQWELFDNLSTAEIVDRVTEDFDDAPAERRNLLVAFLAKRLGYSRFSRKTRLTSKPLWDLLDPLNFARLDSHDRNVLELISQTTSKVGYTLHPKAALAALALWMNGDQEVAERAENALLNRGIPTTSDWLYSVVVELFALDIEYKRNALLELAQGQLTAGRPDSAALVAGFALVAQLDPWRVGAIRSNLIHACDRAATENPVGYAKWINLIADSVLEGELKSSWMERPFQAAIRLALNDENRDDALRAYYAVRPFEASPARLGELFSYPLSRLNTERDRQLPLLMREVEASASYHPTRSIHLLELMVEKMRNTTMIALAESNCALDPLLERLVRLYTRTFHLDSHAVALVRRFYQQSVFADVPDGHFENYFIVCDYDHSFRDRSASVLGFDVSHLDKDTAAKVRYFQTGRAKPNSLTKLLASFRGQEDWLLARLMEAEPVADSVEYVFEQFLELVSDFDFSSQVLRDINANGASISTIEEVSQLPIKKVERVLRPQRSRRLLYAAAAGAASGAAGPITLGLTAIIDTPILLYLAAETCARFCWYYGFDPKKNEDIIAMILGVALQGAGIQSVRFAHVRQDLRRMLIRRSIALGAVSNGAALQLLAPTFGEILIPSKSMFRRKSPQKRALEFGLPTMVAGATVAINVSFVYDLCEAARWVLTDRFLARKYPQWESRF